MADNSGTSDSTGSGTSDSTGSGSSGSTGSGSNTEGNTGQQTGGSVLVSQSCYKFISHVKCRYLTWMCQTLKVIKFKITFGGDFS